VLTADLVRTRRQGSELLVTPLSPKLRPRALELATSLLDLAEACLGATRADLEEAFAQLEVRASEHKLASGLRKLVEDRIEFEQASELEPRALRAEVFAAAAQERKQLAASESWQREAFLAREAARRELAPEALVRALYADLRGAQVLLGLNKPSPGQLVDGYDLAQQQAVLLRATQLVANVRCADAYAYRELFRKLKFFRLLHSIEPRADGGYRIVIDGPFNLFSASTKYGLSLALSLPALLACDEHSITAALRWGKERAPMTFKIEGRARPQRGEVGAREQHIAARLPDEVEALLSRFSALDTPWQAEAAADILEVPGAGLCVPDLRFVHRETGELAYLEVLGYWSREAVFRRVDLATRGLSARVLFAVSSRLRVSEEVLGDQLPSRLYVYKGALSAKELLRRLDQQPGLEDRMEP
jgi:predicted nuclease of restriction endonuclease-like RecB superfamily